VRDHEPPQLEKRFLGWRRISVSGIETKKKPSVPVRRGRHQQPFRGWQRGRRQNPRLCPTARLWSATAGTTCKNPDGGRQRARICSPFSGGNTEAGDIGDPPRPGLTKAAARSSTVT